VNCVICGIRKPRRACPGVRGEICTVCCGREREESIDCPIDCEFAKDAHRHERTPELTRDQIPSQGVEIEDEFIANNEILLAILGSSMVEEYRKTPAITDYDIREALAALVQTFQTLESGLLVSNTPVNPYAAALVDAVRQRLDFVQERLTEEGGPGPLAHPVILKILVVLQRLEVMDNNGRRRSRRFLDILNHSYVPIAESPEIADPEEPRVIL
jgi:hypothetical protein